MQVGEVEAHNQEPQLEREATSCLLFFNDTAAIKYLMAKSSDVCQKR